MKKRVLAVLLAAFMLFALTACSASSTSTTTTTITTSKTDENGNTTTNTVTNEIGISAGTDGVSATNQTTTKTENTGVTSEELAGALAQKFSAGAEGVTADGDKVLFAYDDPETFSYGAIILVMDGGQNLMGREGEITSAGEQWKLVDTEMNAEIPFTLSDTEDNDEQSFVMTFQDGDSAVMTAVDAETIIKDMIAALSEFNT